jgi:2-keto-3-deoxy-L-rhamnonate aldolase RhmA
VAQVGRVSRSSEFRKRLRAATPMVGTFTKTPSAILHEVLGLSQLDCICIDAEHAPFGRTELDACIAALRAADMPALVRVSHAAPHEILSALDCGASGVVIPHVVSAEAAAAAVAAAHYGRRGADDGRGYAGSSRAAGYGTKPMLTHIADSAVRTTVVAQIEDAEALDVLDDIAQVEGIDCLFVGRMDLTVSLGAAKPDDPQVIEAVEKICAAGRRHGRCVGMFVPPSEELGRWRRQGATFFLLASDQQFLLAGAKALASIL